MGFYVLDENNNKVPAYDKEGVLALLAQAIEDGSLDSIVADSAFITKLKCCVGGGTYNIAFIDQAKYNELQTNNQLKENTYYYIIDDTTADDINEELTKLNAAINSLNKQHNEEIAQINEKITNIQNGTTPVAQANNAATTEKLKYNYNYFSTLKSLTTDYQQISIVPNPSLAFVKIDINYDQDMWLTLVNVGTGNEYEVPFTVNSGTQLASIKYQINNGYLEMKKSYNTDLTIRVSSVAYLEITK